MTEQLVLMYLQILLLTPVDFWIYNERNLNSSRLWPALLIVEDLITNLEHFDFKVRRETWLPHQGMNSLQGLMITSYSMLVAFEKLKPVKKLQTLRTARVWIQKQLKTIKQIEKVLETRSVWRQLIPFDIICASLGLILFVNCFHQFSVHVFRSRRLERLSSHCN